MHFRRDLDFALLPLAILRLLILYTINSKDSLVQVKEAVSAWWTDPKINTIDINVGIGRSI